MFVVTLPASAAAYPKAFALRAASAGANVLEIRGDLTPDVAAFDSSLPLLVSPRGTGEALINKLKPSFVDLELEEILEIPKNVTIIRSFHDHEETPTITELLNIVKNLLATKPDIVKIATMIRSYDDLRTLDTLHHEIPSSQKRIILGMGPKAHLNRMLSPLKNALTYTFIDDGEESAPGQVPLSLHRLTAHCKNPKIYGLIGGMDCVRSLSPLIHNTLFHRHKIDALYTLYPTESLEDLHRNKDILNNHGLSVTAPWKKDIMQYPDRLDPLVEKIGSMNTAVMENERWMGYTTDVIGIAEGYDWSAVKSLAILGSGGVVPAVIEGCRSAGVHDITVYARSREDSDALARRFSVTAQDLSSISSIDVDAVLCTVSDDVDLPLPKNATIAIDLRYGRQTKFLTAATQRGWHTADGLSMLIHQALEQFRLFTGIMPTMDDRNAITAAGNGRAR